MKRFLVAVVGVALGIAGQASAADLPAAPYKTPVMIPALYDWSGFYTGLNGGWGTSNTCWDDVTPAGAFIAAAGCHNVTGGSGGGQIGFRLQTGPLVYGIEVQGDWAGMRGTNVSLSTGNNNNTFIDSYGLFTGQIGYAIDAALLYIKGGGAVVGSRFNVTAPGTNLLLATAGTQGTWGGTVGAGVEWTFFPDWSLAVEYDHVFLADRVLAFNTPSNPTPGAFFGSEHIRQSVDLVTLRLNYRWGGPVIAKY